MKLVGVQEKKGNYNGINYHNYLLHCLKVDGESLGEISEVVKVKVANAREVFGTAVDITYLDSLIGKDIRCYYDKFGVSSEIRVTEDTKKA